MSKIIQLRPKQPTWCICCREQMPDDSSFCSKCGFEAPDLKDNPIWVHNECGAGVLRYHVDGFYCWKCNSKVNITAEIPNAEADNSP